MYGNENAPTLCVKCSAAGCLHYADRDPSVADAWRWECRHDDAPEPSYQPLGQNAEAPAFLCEGHYDDDAALTSGVGIGEPIYCDGPCVRG
ncbi:hypothetical protein [Streptomyces sp. NPDC055036]